MLQGGSHSPALRTGYDRLKQFCGIPTLLPLSDPLCSYVIRLYTSVFLFLLYKNGAQVVCAYRFVLGFFWGKIGMDNSCLPFLLELQCVQLT